SASSIISMAVRHSSSEKSGRFARTSASIAGTSAPASQRSERSTCFRVLEDATDEVIVAPARDAHRARDAGDGSDAGVRVDLEDPGLRVGVDAHVDAHVVAARDRLEGGE